MQRTDGLVQRRVANQANVNNDNQDHRHSNGDYDTSKETRFTLMEEVLLLGLKDKEVSFRIHRFENFIKILLFDRAIHHSGTIVFRLV